MRNRLTFCILMLSALCVNSGCGLTLGPVVEKQAVIVRPGKPVKIIENRVVRCQQIETNAVVTQDVGGWIAMPTEHWDVIRAVLEKQSSDGK